MTKKRMWTLPTESYAHASIERFFSEEKIRARSYKGACISENRTEFREKESYFINPQAVFGSVIFGSLIYRGDIRDIHFWSSKRLRIWEWSIFESILTSPWGKSSRSPYPQYFPCISQRGTKWSSHDDIRTRYSLRFALMQYGNGFPWSIQRSKKCIGIRGISFTSAIVFSVRVTIRRAVNGHGPFTTAIFVMGKRSRSSCTISGKCSNSFPRISWDISWIWLPSWKTKNWHDGAMGLMKRSMRLCERCLPDIEPIYPMFFKLFVISFIKYITLFHTPIYFFVRKP